MKLAPKGICSGCSACQAACSTGAVLMVADEDGFLYPVIDGGKCIGCGRCRKVCPSLNHAPARRPKLVIAARAKDEVVRRGSSSGGMFALLAERVLADGGVVFGAAWTDDWAVAHRGVESAEGLLALKGTKYAQSRIGTAYAEVKRALGQNRFVLFSGTPCQVAGLLRFLGGPQENLLTVEIICHAVPSPAAWRSYLRQRTDGHGGLVSANIRDKSFGWMNKTIRLGFSDGTEYMRSYREDPFIWAFGGQLINRPSCYRCSVRSLRSGADLTIGDYWGIERFHPEFACDLGMSAVLMNTDKGELFFSRIAVSCDTIVSTYENVRTFNRNLEECQRPHRRREECLARLRTEGFDAVVSSVLHDEKDGGFWRKLFRRKRG